jgi:HlyD family secretion protein
MKFNRTVWIILLLVVLGVAGYFGWQYFFPAETGTTYQTVPVQNGDISAIVGATGSVRPNQSAQLAWQTSGTVESVTVKVGDSVKKDDVLAMLEKTSLPQNVILAEADLLNAQRTLEDLQASNLSRAQAELTLAQAQKAVEDAKDKVDGIYFPRGSDTKIENTQANIDSLDQQIAQVRRLYQTVVNLPNGDSRKAPIVAQLTSLELQRDQLIAELNYMTGKPDTNDISQRRASYEVAMAQLEDAQRRLDRVKDGPDPVELAQVKAQITAAEATIKSSRITAPFDGTITQAEPLPGDQAAPGKLAFRLDDLSHLLVDVQVSEIDINTVKVGQVVTMSFDAVLGKTYNGTVVEVSQVGSVVQGAVEFTVTVELLDADEDVHPGMTAAVNILTRELKNVLIIPNRAVRFLDGQRVVYLLVNGEQVPVKVRLGASDDTNSEVVEGDIKAGDLIILNPTTTMAPGGPMGGGMGGN